jgi:hypothetical protein
MRFVKRPNVRFILALALCATAIPVLGQDSPKSILPPGFGDAPDEPKAAPTPAPPPSSSGPDLSGPSEPRRPASSGGSTRRSPSVSGGGTSPSVASALPAGTAGEDGEEEIDIAAVLPDLPPSQRRSLDQIGVLASDDGDMGIDAYGATPGRYLDYVMQRIKAPIASRWASIALRRSLLSRVKTPGDIDGADFAGQRAMLLLRMGEGLSARQLVQAVDADRSTPFLREAGLQAALANADPGAMCPMVDYTPAAVKEDRWRMARAVCFALSAEPAQASALIDSVRDAEKVPIIDVLLAEKVIGAGGNSRRSVNILWEDVKELTTWRFGMATAAAVPVPDALLKTVGPQMRAWRASASLLSAPSRVGDAEIAAALGVYSSDALVQAYAEAADATDPGNARGTGFSQLRDAYSAPTSAARLSAMAQFWKGSDSLTTYARLIATARAANEIQATSESAGSVDQIVASMLSAGLDQQAVRWANIAGNGSLAQALLAVGSPMTVIRLDSGDVSGFDKGESGRRAQFLLAGMAGLGRLSESDANDAASSLDVPLGRKDAWTRALDRAVAGSEKGTVTLLVALGLQGQGWDQVPAHRLYHAVSAMHRVGLDGEARMIAAEALMRS